MADSVEAICNLALIMIGETQGIESIDEGTVAADVCLAIYEQDRDEVLSGFPWPFATVRAKPAPILASTLAASAVPGGWLYAYAVPADTLRVRSIYTSLNPLPSNVPGYAQEFDSTLGASVILSNEDEPEFLFTYRIVDIKQFSPLFVRALAARMAEDLAAGLRKDPKVAQLAHAYYLAALADAKKDALKGQNLDAWTPAHITARS